MNRLPGLVEHAVFLGSFRELRVRILGGSLIKAVFPNDGTPLAYEQGRRRDAAPPLRTRSASCATPPAEPEPSRGAARRRKTRDTRRAEEATPMATESTIVEIDRERIQELAEREEKQLDERTQRLAGDVRARPEDALRRRRLVLPGARPVADLPRARRAAPRSGTSTGTSCSTSTTASARWCRGTRIPAIAQGGRRALSARHALRRARPRTAIVVAEELQAPLGPAAAGAT